MLKHILLPVFLLWLASPAGAQSRIVVEVNNLRNDKGNCIVCLYDNAKAFSGKGEPMRKMKVVVQEKAATAVFNDVPAGTYAIAVIHDANNNDRFDSNFIGLPTEGYGASQNKLPFAAAPKFDENKFVLHANTTSTINIKLRYLL